MRIVAESLRLGTLSATIRLTGDDSGGACELIEYAGHFDAALSTMHFHESGDELVYVLQGRVRIELGSRVIVADVGSSLWIPRGAVHRLLNGTDLPMRALVMHTPALGGDRLLAGLSRTFSERGNINSEDVATLGSEYDYVKLN